MYPYLTPREFVSLCATLSGLSGEKPSGASKRRSSARGSPMPPIAPFVGCRRACSSAPESPPRSSPTRELSAFDEPMSGLDPVGRKEVRDLILDEKKRG